jgi:hypothetical protein
VAELATSTLHPVLRNKTKQFNQEPLVLPQSWWLTHDCPWFYDNIQPGFLSQLCSSRLSGVESVQMVIL